jgi:mannitol/fructose-specific phosphotransferase system IIA component (Ntr-type)
MPFVTRRAEADLTATAIAGLDPERIFPDLTGATREDVLRDFSQRLAQTGAIRDGEDLARRLIEREGLGCTGLGGGIAIPHCKLKNLSEIVVAIGRCREPINFQASDGVPVSILFLILSPADAPGLHLQALARLSRWLKTPGVAENLRRARTPEEILDAVREGQPRPAAAHG